VRAIVAITSLHEGGPFFVTLKDDYVLDAVKCPPRINMLFPTSRFLAQNRSPETQSTLVISPFLLLFMSCFFLCVVRK